MSSFPAPPENLPLRGCLNPDGSHYQVKYVTSEGHLTECFDERKSLREIKPFQNILKFVKKSKDRGHYQFRQHVGTSKGAEQYDWIWSFFYIIWLSMTTESSHSVAKIGSNVNLN